MLPRRCHLEIRGQAYCNWLASDGLDGMEDLLVANPDINCLLSENDDMALGAQKATQLPERTIRFRFSVRQTVLKKAIFN